MKKLLIGILIPVVLIAGAGVTLYFLASDSSSPSYVSSGESSEDLLNRKLFESFENTGEDHAITFNVTQDDLNQIITNAFSSADSSVQEYVRGIDMEIQEDEYHIYVYANASILKTKIDITCQLQQDEDNFYLNISNLKIGSLGLKSIALSLLKNYLGDSQLNSMFASAGISIQSELDNERFVYAKSDVKSDINNLLSSANSALATSLVSNFLDMDLLSFDFNSQLKATIELEPLNTNVNFCCDENMLSSSALNLEEYKEDVNSLLQEEIITSDEASLVFEYLTLGYDALSTEQQDAIDDMDLTSIGIQNNSTHLGYSPIGADINSVFTSLTASEWITGEGILISEQMVNNYIQAQDLIGYTYLLTSDDSVAYITIDNFYINMTNIDDIEHMDVVLGINVNGYETSLILENTKASSTSYGMTLTNENIYFGSKAINDDLKNTIYTLVKENLPENDFITFDGQGTFTINFESYLSSINDAIHQFPGYENKNLTLSTTVVGDSLTDTNAGFRLSGVIA